MTTAAVMTSERLQQQGRQLSVFSSAWSVRTTAGLQVSAADRTTSAETGLTTAPVEAADTADTADCSGMDWRVIISRNCKQRR